MNTPDLRDIDLAAHERRAQALRQQTLDRFAARIAHWIRAASRRFGPAFDRQPGAGGQPRNAGCSA